MSSRAFVIPLRDLEDSPRVVREQLSDEWLRRSLADTDATPAGTADGRVDVVLTKTGREVLVQGRVHATIEVPCSRTLDPARYPVDADVFLMLSPRGGSGSDRRRGGVAAGAGAGRTRRRGEAEEPERLLSEEDAAADHYEGDEVVLDEFLREFILLEIPMVPLREDLRDAPFEANPSPPGERPLDPRLSPLAELKARLEKKE